jgi:hypothetical protein
LWPRPSSFIGVASQSGIKSQGKKTYAFGLICTETHPVMVSPNDRDEALGKLLHEAPESILSSTLSIVLLFDIAIA